jgi:shikimate dehydrogenase
VTGVVAVSVSARTTVCAVIGEPVQHSLSPLLFNAAFATVGLDWTYVAFPVAAGDAGAALAAMRSLGIRGYSVTMPHKDDVARLVDHPSAAVAALGACNSVLRRADGSLEGHNTDGDGFVDSFAAATGRSVRGLRVMVLGAGGAARSIIEAVGRGGASSVVVVNRTAAKAEVAAALAGPPGEVGPPPQRIDIDSLLTVDVLINATSMGMGAQNDPESAVLPISTESLHQGLTVVDIVYRPFVTPLLAAAAAAGATTVGGLGMLIHQAGHQFRIWTGMEPPIAAMTAAAEAYLNRQP